MRSLATVAVLALLVPVGACALSARPVDETLRGAGAGDGAGGGLAELVSLTQQALAAAEAAPTDVDAQVAAARRLFQSADLKLQMAIAAWLRAHPQATRAEVLAADEQLGDEVRADVVSFCTRGLELADRAAVAHAEAVGVRLHQALHLSLLAWANGPTRSLMAGYGPKMVKAIDAALALDAAFDGGAPLRLQGRFRGQAPWPYGDVPAAREALQRACTVAAVPVNHLFYGDVLAKAGDVAAAVAQWRLAVTATADESTRWSAELLREQARARLAAQP